MSRIQHRNQEIQAVLTLSGESALEQAAQADQEFAAREGTPGPRSLLGIPVLIKDMIETAGIRTTAGSKFFDNYLPVEDAEVVRRLKASGVVVLGKTQTHELALGVMGVNPFFGTVRNPRDLSRISGGSSSGSAAAVASGMCLAALGTDTGGSIRIPASLCGVVGLKPTYGRVSTRGVIPLSWNLDTVGPLTRSVQDAALLLQVLAGYDPHDPGSAKVPVADYGVSLEDGWPGLHIAVGVGKYMETSAPVVLEAVQRAALLVEREGARLGQVNMDWMAELARANTAMTQADAAAFHHERLVSHPDWFGPDVRQRLEQGAALSSSDYALARWKQQEGRRRFEELFTEFDLLLLPTTPIQAPLIEDAGALQAAQQLTRFTAPMNLAGLPAISMPCGSRDQLPIELQLVSAPWQEAVLLRSAAAWERIWNDGAASSKQGGAGYFRG